jgi:hypothetical protein
MPGVFAAAALAGMVLTVSSLLATPAVDIGNFRSEGHDALSLYLGHGLYHDPAGSSYTGLLYTPLMPAIIAVLDNLALWNGWPVLITVLASVALGLLVAGLGWRSSPVRGPWTVVGALGIGGVAVWLATSAVGLLYLGWSDQLAWAFALAGLVFGADARRPARAAAIAVVLFTLAFWSKQTTIAAPVAYLLWLMFLTLRGERSALFTAAVIVGLVALNLAILGVLALLTGGWEYHFNFVLPTRHARVHGVSRFASDLLQVVSVPALWAAALGAGALWRTRHPRAYAYRRTRPGAATAVPLLVFAVIGIPFAMYFRSKQGGNPNQYFGVIWALGALGAIAWGATRESGRQGWADGVVLAAIVAAVVLTAVGANRFDLNRLRIRYAVSVPATLRTLAQRAAVFDPLYTDLVPHNVYPDVLNIADLLAGGDQPMSVVRPLLERRFEFARTYAAAVGPPALAYLNQYASAFGKREADYFWKLDQLIAAGYAPAPGLPPGVVKRRPGPNLAGALSRCFGPFHLAGGAWSIRAGGGFWCETSPGVISLARAPAPLSELVSSGSLRLSGTLRLTARPGGQVVLLGGAGWSVAVSRRATGWLTVERRAGAALLQRSVPGANLSLDLGGGAGVPAGPDPAAARVRLLATPAARVRIDMTALRLG